MKPFLEFIFNHWELWVALGILLVLLLIYEVKSHRGQGLKLTPQEAVILINQEAVIFDIRDHDLFAKGHIIHSIQLNKDDYQSNKVTKYKTRPIILVCQKGDISQALTAQWIKAGYTKMHVLSGGIDAWKAAGFPLV